MDSTTGAYAEFELDSAGVFTFIEGDQSLIKDTDHVLLPSSERVCVLGMGASDSRIIIDDICGHIEKATYDWLRLVSLTNHQDHVVPYPVFKPKHSLARNPRFVSKGNPFKTQMRSVNRNR